MTGTEETPILHLEVPRILMEHVRFCLQASIILQND